MDFIKQVFELIKFQSNDILPQTKGAFKALADAVVPQSPELLEKDHIQSFGALESLLDEYLIWSLDNYLSMKIFIDKFDINIANLTAGLMNTAAQQLIDTGRNTEPINREIDSEAGTFASLAPIDRFHAITILEELEVDTGSLPIPFNIYPSIIFSTSLSVALLSIIGYYTEWSGYGSTRLETPEKRRLENFPMGWKQAGYPGPSKGYRVFRGYLFDKFTE